MPGDPALPGKGIGGDLDAVMRLAAFPPAGMAGMKMRFVDHGEPAGRERLAQACFDQGLHAHTLTFLMRQARRMSQRRRMMPYGAAGRIGAMGGPVSQHGDAVSSARRWGASPSMKPRGKDLRRYTGIPLTASDRCSGQAGLRHLLRGMRFMQRKLLPIVSQRPPPPPIIAHVMDLKSPLFDRIRIKPRKAEEARDDARAPTCEFPGCKEPGQYRAPKGRGRRGQYYRFFCLQHVRRIQCQV